MRESLVKTKLRKRPIQKVEETPPLSDQYYKAKKYLMLFSALLFAWAFIGIDIQNSKIANEYVTFKSPEAAPYVLVILTIYFLYRTLIEWNQSGSRYTKNQYSRFDLIISVIISMSAMGVFIFQILIEKQLFLLVAESVGLIMGIIIFILFSFLFTEVILEEHKWYKSSIRFWSFPILKRRIILFLLIVFILTVAWIDASRIIEVGLYGVIVLLAVFSLIFSLKFLQESKKN